MMIMASVCIFCCTHLKGDSYEEEEVASLEVGLLFKFLKVTKSHFGIDFTRLIRDSGDLNLKDKVCLKCEQSLRSICQLYREMEGIRLRMEWEFGTLIGKMEAVGTTPSKVKWLRKNQSANGFQKMTDFRNNFISKCNQSLDKSKPKLILQPIEQLIPNITIPDNLSDNFDVTSSVWILPEDNVDVDVNTDDENQIDDHTENKYSPGNSSDDDDESSSPTNKTPIKKPFKCTQCPLAYTQRKNLLRHQRSHHSHHNFDDLKVIPNDTTWTSWNNAEDQTEKKSVPQISPVVHKSRYDEDNESSTGRGAAAELPIKKPFKCPQCPLAYTEQKNLRRHQKSHHPLPNFKDIPHPQIEKPFKCPNCPVQFFHHSSLSRHQQILHRNLYRSRCTKPRSNTKTIKYFKKKISKTKKPSHGPQDMDNEDDDLDNDNHNDDYDPSNIKRQVRKKPFKCSQCPLAYTKQRNLRRHQVSHHHHPRKLNYRNPQIEKPFKCPHCPITFSRKNSLRRHQRIFHWKLYQPQRIIHPKTGDEKPPKFIPCPICQQSVGRYSVKSHFDLNHSTKDIDPQTIQKCDHPNCPAYFRTLFQLSRHKRIAHVENHDISRITCPICSKVCTIHCNLKVHMKTQHDDENPDLPLPCDLDPQCSKRFPNEAVLKWHQMYYFHNPLKRPKEIINCPECHKNINGLGAFKKHQKKHQSPDGPWICELCGVQFKSKGVLKTHGLFHTNPDNWSFQCEECGKKCATKHYLKDHMNVHSDLKPYFCDICGNRYKSRHQLRKHINKFHAKEGFQDIPRKMEKPTFISRRLPTPASAEPAT